MATVSAVRIASAECPAASAAVTGTASPIVASASTSAVAATQRNGRKYRHETREMVAAIAKPATNAAPVIAHQASAACICVPRIKPDCAPVSMSPRRASAISTIIAVITPPTMAATSKAGRREGIADIDGVDMDDTDMDDTDMDDTDMDDTDMGGDGIGVDGSDVLTVAARHVAIPKCGA